MNDYTRNYNNHNRPLTSITPQFGADISIFDVLAQFAPRPWRENPRSPKNRYSMRCPLPGHQGDREHRDHSGSFSVDETGQLFRCFGCGGQGNTQKLLRILTGDQAPTQIQAPPRPRRNPPRRPNTPKFEGATIDELIAAKGLGPEYAEVARGKLGWKDTAYYGSPAICMPYADQEGKDAQLRYRVGITGDRFRWAKDSKLRLYGLEQLSTIKEAGYVILVEGETDTLALRVSGFPALGAPGANNFRREWAEDLQGLTIFVWQEPGRAGENLVEAVRDSLPEALVIHAPEGAKDPAELAAQRGSPEAFRQAMNDLLDQAEPPPEERNVRNKDVTKGERNILVADKRRDRGERPALWKEAAEWFVMPSGVKSTVGTVGLYSERDRKGVAANFVSNTWRNPYNAQFKRKKLFFNILPRINGPQLYKLTVPVDDWDNKLHQRLAKRINRAMREEDGWMWVDNAVSRGYFIYMTSAPGLAGFEPVEDAKPVLVDALQGIRPPGPEDEDRFRPIGGSDNWVAKADGTGEQNHGRWRVIATWDTPQDLLNIEAEAVVNGIKTEYVKDYWRTQVGGGLQLAINTAEEAAKFYLSVGAKLTRYGQSLIEEGAML